MKQQVELAIKPDDILTEGIVPITAAKQLKIFVTFFRQIHASPTFLPEILLPPIMP